MPAELRPRRMVASVAAVAAEARQVDAADERHSIVDDDRLLVMAMKRPFARVQSAGDRPRPPELVAHAADGSARWPEDGNRRTRPEEHAHVDAPCRLGQKIPQDDGRPESRNTKSGDMNHPVRWTCDRAPRISSTISASAASPSIRTSTRLSGRGGGAFSAQPPGRASSTGFLRRANRRRCFSRTAAVMLFPIARSRRSIVAAVRIRMRYPTAAAPNRAEPAMPNIVRRRVLVGMNKISNNER